MPSSTLHAEEAGGRGHRRWVETEEAAELERIRVVGWHRTAHVQYRVWDQARLPCCVGIPMPATAASFGCWSEKQAGLKWQNESAFVLSGWPVRAGSALQEAGAGFGL